MFAILPCLAVVGPAVISLATYRACKGLSLLLAVIVSVCTKDENRRAACVEAVRALCQARPRPSSDSARPDEAAK